MSILLDYIKKERDKGFSLKKIKKALLSAGHDIKIVEKELGKFEKEAVVFEKKEIKEVKKEEKKIEKFFKDMFLKINWKYIGYSLIVLIVLILIISFIVTRPIGEEAEQREQMKLAEKMLAGCEYVVGVEEKNICILKASVEADSTEFCDEISTEINDILYYACVDRYWTNEDCVFEGLIGEGDDCLLNLALRDGDLYQCYQLEDNLKIDNCIMGIAGVAVELNDSSICLGNYDCYAQVAAITKNHDFCYGLEDQQYCFLKLAIELNDWTTCKELGKGTFNSCVDKVLNPEKEIQDICEQAEDEDFRDMCLKIKDCEKIQDQAVKELCLFRQKEYIYDSIFILNENKEIEFKVSPTAYLMVALNNEDVSGCEKVAGAEKDLCLAVFRSDEKLCDTYLEKSLEQGEDLEIKNLCMAWVKKDKDLCGNIEIESNRYYCLEYFYFILK